jgi:hypothetical protein
LREQVFGSLVWRVAMRLGTYFGGKRKFEMMKKAQVVQKAGERK